MKRQAKHGAVEAFEDSSQIVIYMQTGKDCRQENVDNHAGDDWKKKTFHSLAHGHTVFSL